MTLYQRVMSLARHDRAQLALAIVAFADSSFLPLPPHALLIPLLLARPERAWRLALICSAASVAGGFLGYGIGSLLYDTIGRWIIVTYGYQSAFQHFHELFQRWGAWIIVAKGLTPIPFKIVTIASGVAGFDLFDFTWSSAISRAGQFLMIAAVVRRFGPRAEPYIERWLWQIGLAFVAVVVLGIVAINYI